eukprot:SAG31_NODE_2561_length_5481_cov_2.689335_3_plen_106_part_00
MQPDAALLLALHRSGRGGGAGRLHDEAKSTSDCSDQIKAGSDQAGRCSAGPSSASSSQFLARAQFKLTLLDSIMLDSTKVSSIRTCTRAYGRVPFRHITLSGPHT